MEKDLIKCIVLQQEEFEPSRNERLRLMRWLWSSVQYIYSDYDFSHLLDKVRELNELHDKIQNITKPKKLSYLEKIANYQQTAKIAYNKKD